MGSTWRLHPQQLLGFWVSLAVLAFLNEKPVVQATHEGRRSDSQWPHFLSSAADGKCTPSSPLPIEAPAPPEAVSSSQLPSDGAWPQSAEGSWPSPRSLASRSSPSSPVPFGPSEPAPGPRDDSRGVWALRPLQPLSPGSSSARSSATAPLLPAPPWLWLLASLASSGFASLAKRRSAPRGLGEGAVASLSSCCLGLCHVQHLHFPDRENWAPLFS